MAGDWVKMRCSLGTDPKVIAIGRYLARDPDFISWLTRGSISECPICDGALRHLVTGALHNVWSAANEHANDGAIAGASLAWIDAICGIVGFGSAMASVGWAEGTDGKLVFPKFDSHNTSGAERQRRYRENRRNSRNVTRDVTGDSALRPREEKRREEKNICVSSKKKKHGGSPPRKNFVPPTVDQVREYCQARANGIDPDQFVDHYIANGWVQGKSGKAIKDWQAAVRTWERNEFGRSSAAIVTPASRLGTKEDAARYSAYGAPPE
jgi:hypothetical protein